jgi:VWFA-related protein
MINRRVKFLCLRTFGAVGVLLLTANAIAQREPNRTDTSGRDVTILVTAHAHNDRTRALVDRLKPEDFSVREDNRPQRIISVKRPSEAPPVIAVLIQDDLVSRVSNEIRGIRDFIRSLPEGSRVMTGYLTVGSLRVTQDFTTDRERAAESLRILLSSVNAAPYNPYIEVLEALRRFDSQPAGRRMVLMVSDGLDVSRGFRDASPMLSVDLDRAINEAQRRGIAVFAIYAPSVGLTSRSHLAMTYGQGSLIRIADETGGDAFFTGSDFVSFDPYFREFTELLGRQWLITYHSTSSETGFRKIEVKTDYDLELLYPAGYRLRSKDIPRP